MKASVKASAAVAVVATGLVLGGCSGGGSGDDAGGRSITVMYEKTDSFTVLDTLMQTAKKEFEAAHSGATVDLQPVAASDDDYKTRLQLSLKSADTAPDVFYEDTFNVRADIEAGYLRNLDDQVADWSDWSTFDDAAKKAGQGADGSVYALPLGADTRVIWYNKNVLQKAGVTVPWQPKTWDDILDAAAKIKAAEPDAVPFNMYAGTGTGEGTVMQSFYELLYGTGDGTGLYDDSAKKWVVGSQGFVDSLTFLKTLYDKKYSVTPAQALDPNVWKSVFGDLFPKDKIGGTVEGSYAPSFWEKNGAYPWPDYETAMGVAAFPTQNGQEPGGVSMSGGWTLASSAQSKHPDLAFDFMTTVLNKKNALWWAVNNAKIAVRTDVAQEKEYLAANPFVGAVSDVLSVSHYRPADSDYPQISVAAQKATEDVITGSQTPQQAAAAYDDAVRQIVGDDKVISK